MDEQEIYDAFGLESTAVNEQDAGEPASGDESAGVNDQEVAGPDNDDGMTEDDGASFDDENGGEEEAGGISHTAAENDGGERDDNARFAAARRKAESERDEAIAKMKAEREAEIRKAELEVIKEFGFVDPYTGRLIETKEQLAAFSTARDEAGKREFMTRHNMTNEQYDSFVDSLPEVRAAREAARAADEAKSEADRAAARTKIDSEIKAISELDPSVKSLSDIAALDTYPEIYAMAKRGYSLVDAYKLANFETLSGRQVAAAKQAAINSVVGRSQLTKTASRGTGGVSVPADVMEQYRALIPDATDAEILRHYQKNHK